MPKIAAENIEEHIRRQTERILDASAELFTQNGYRATDLGKIATSAGLARNSLYRYFASKDHILVGVLQREMAQFIDQTAALAETYPDPAERIDAWLDLQMELAMGPCHAMIRMLGDMNDASDDLRQEIRSLHVPPRKALETAVSELLADRDRDPKVVSAMIASMVQSAGGIAMGATDTEAVVRELKTSVRRILTRGE
jgi:AcrR family transcriptional regulator